MSRYRKRYRFVRDKLGCGTITSAFIACLNECSNLPDNYVGFMFYIWEIEE